MQRWYAISFGLGLFFLFIGFGRVFDVKNHFDWAKRNIEQNICENTINLAAVIL